MTMRYYYYCGISRTRMRLLSLLVVLLLSSSSKILLRTSCKIRSTLAFNNSNIANNKNKNNYNYNRSNKAKDKNYYNNDRRQYASPTVGVSLLSLIRLSMSSQQSAAATSQQSWIEKAQEALSNFGSDDDKENDDDDDVDNDELIIIKNAEMYLMNAVQEVNGAVMTHPSILRGFEDLFRIKIDIGSKKLLETMEDSDNDEHDDDDEMNTIININKIKLNIIQDRIGLASLLSDQGKYQNASYQLEKVIEMKSVLQEEDKNQPQGTRQLDKVLSMLFRSRASICDWNDYNISSRNLIQSTCKSLELQLKVVATTDNEVVQVQVHAVPAVHPFEALAWPCISLKDATSIAYKYAMRAIVSSSVQLLQQQKQVQQKLEQAQQLQQLQVGGMMTSATATVVQQIHYTQQDLLKLLPWTDLNERFNSRSTNTPFVKVMTPTSKNSKKSPSTSTSTSTSTSSSSYLSSLTLSSVPLSSSSSSSSSSYNANANDNDKTSKRIIRVGYLSPDFTGKHPLAFLMQNVFQFHNQQKFEIYLYSLDQEDDGSLEVIKIINSSSTSGNGNNGENQNQNENENQNTNNNWTVLTGSVSKMSNIILNDKLDILIDLCGYTGTSLIAEIMAYCRLSQQLQQLQFSSISSPTSASNSNTNNSNMMIHVSYMGFPGSSGSPYIDYMIADPIVIPSEVQYRKYYTENILFMPHCYFVNSHKYIINNEGKSGNDSSENNNNDSIGGGSSESVDERPQKQQRHRSYYGLPNKGYGFVFCCHSRPDKIDPYTFKTWINALKRTREEGRQNGNIDMSNAVLWLLRSSSSSSNTTTTNSSNDSTTSNNNNGQQPQCRMEMNLIRYARKIMNNNNNNDEDDLDDDNENNNDDVPAQPEQSEPEYLIFCNKVSRNEHLNRLSIGADLFLDTPSYNAHTVGCDCLSQGVPMISLLRNRKDNGNDIDNFIVPTDKLASRVGASLLKSAISCTRSGTSSRSGSSSSLLSDKLIVSTMKEYEDTMVECARENNHNTNSNSNKDSNTNDFSSYRKQLLNNLHTAPLWDTKRWVQNLETGLNEMMNIKQHQQEQQQQQQQNDNNMDIYVIDENDERL